MKREGRQHGMVRTSRILPPYVSPRSGTRFINKFESPPTAGLFTKVPSKPTNHSKFTGKCGIPRCTQCHLQPSCKSKHKSKGTQKLKSSDVALSSRLISWRVVDGQPGLSFSGFSATELLDHLSSVQANDAELDDGDFGYDGTVDSEYPCHEDNEINDEIGHDDNISYHEVGFVLDQVEGDDDWCLVQEM